MYIVTFANVIHGSHSQLATVVADGGGTGPVNGGVPRGRPATRTPSSARQDAPSSPSDPRAPRRSKECTSIQPCERTHGKGRARPKRQAPLPTSLPPLTTPTPQKVTNTGPLAASSVGEATPAGPRLGALLKPHSSKLIPLTFASSRGSSPV
ncbi:TPA: hypothetical protein ACH3X2_013591 [Trebouxia sp. C0005]